MIKVILLDIDGVLTDGRIYSDGIGHELKSLNLKDLDAITSMRGKGIVVGCVSGEDTPFSQSVARYVDFAELGCKTKSEFLIKYCEKNHLSLEDVMYIGDGKYDINALKIAGISLCPADALKVVQDIVDWVLETKGGCGCIAELYDNLESINEIISLKKNNMGIIKSRLMSHCFLIKEISGNRNLLCSIEQTANNIIESYKNGGQLFLCGNGGSAADAQHIAAEMVGRFYLERRAYPAEALSTNTSVITSLANDYDYNRIFARQIEAKGREGDVLVGITTSGKSPNILYALKSAKEKNMRTVLMSGKAKEYLPVRDYADEIIEIPSDDTPRIQEGHILIGHIICEIVESKLTEGNYNE